MIFNWKLVDASDPAGKVIETWHCFVDGRIVGRVEVSLDPQRGFICSASTDYGKTLTDNSNGSGLAGAKRAVELAACAEATPTLVCKAKSGP
jgi:hypothetical protein